MMSAVRPPSTSQPTPAPAVFMVQPHFGPTSANARDGAKSSPPQPATNAVARAEIEPMAGIYQTSAGRWRECNPDRQPLHGHRSGREAPGDIDLERTYDIKREPLQAQSLSRSSALECAERAAPIHTSGHVLAVDAAAELAALQARRPPD